MIVLFYRWEIICLCFLALLETLAMFYYYERQFPSQWPWMVLHLFPFVQNYFFNISILFQPSSYPLQYIHMPIPYQWLIFSLFLCYSCLNRSASWRKSGFDINAGNGAKGPVTHMPLDLRGQSLITPGGRLLTGHPGQGHGEWKAGSQPGHGDQCHLSSIRFWFDSPN